MKKTPWFPCSVKPVREGWYEVKWGNHSDLEIYMRYWNGRSWEGLVFDSYDVWRGLAEEPKEFRWKGF